METEKAKAALVEANLRLGFGHKVRKSRLALVLDLIQESNIGLIRAAEKFDYRLGYKFSAYAFGGSGKQCPEPSQIGQVIRIPVHKNETLNKYSRISRELERELGHTPES